VELVVAATTDIHGRVRGWNYDLDAPDPAVGLARAATIVDSLRDATAGRVVLVDAGDIIQGNALGFVAARVATSDAVHPVMAAMNAMRYDAARSATTSSTTGCRSSSGRRARHNSPLAANARNRTAARPSERGPVVDRGGVKVRHRRRDDAGLDGLGPRQPDEAASWSATSCRRSARP
jgi:2',3'-cyclic-nucleotide 2'-phosphodiesterase/3'-nucleotidase